MSGIRVLAANTDDPLVEPGRSQEAATQLRGAMCGSGMQRQRQRESGMRRPADHDNEANLAPMFTGRCNIYNALTVASTNRHIFG